MCEKNGVKKSLYTVVGFDPKINKPSSFPGDYTIVIKNTLYIRGNPLLK